MRFRKWEPVDGVPLTLFVEELRDGLDGLRLLLRCRRTNSVLLVAYGSVLSYRNTDEGGLIGRLNEKEFDEGCLFTVEGSDYLEWFHVESGGAWEDRDVVHYAFYTPDDCIDVLSYYPPKVEWLLVDGETPFDS